jgi:hypothetical protein
MATTTDDLLKQILSAHLAQIALLQSIQAMIREQAVTSDRRPIDYPEAVKALEIASYQLASR